MRRKSRFLIVLGISLAFLFSYVKNDASAAAINAILNTASISALSAKEQTINKTTKAASAHAMHAHATPANDVSVNTNTVSKKTKRLNTIPINLKKEKNTSVGEQSDVRQNDYASLFSMPFYNLEPQMPQKRASFSTGYSKSSAERKHNIKLAAKSLNHVLIDVGGEFSFNRTVGRRTAERGYKTAKIISGGQFVDGVGGGVCQVSTTLYNAAILAGLYVTEYHNHSLPVGYVAPSFDAMVNSGSADLRFVNTTHNPIIIETKADDASLTVTIIGEPLDGYFVEESVIKEYIPAPEYVTVTDTKNEYPDLYEGETKVIRYSKQGLKSEGFLKYIKNGKVISKRKIRHDTYNPAQGLIVIGTAKRPVPLPDPSSEPLPDVISETI